MIFTQGERKHVMKKSRFTKENTKLKRLVADLSLDKAMPQDVLSKKL